ncbi:MAG: DNA repair protein RecO [Desulfopila sp.]
MTPTIQVTDGIVLDSWQHGESDLIVTLFCREGGRSTAIAKGARKSLRRFVNKLERFSFLRVSLRQRNPSALAFLEEAELHASFIHLRDDIRRYTAASVIIELALLATREGESDERSYLLLLWSLRQLDTTAPHLLVVMLFLLRFLDYIGYRPQLSHCFSCGEKIGLQQRSGTFAFSIVSGGLLCPDCTGPTRQSSQKLSLATVLLLQPCQDAPYSQLQGLKFPDHNLYEALNVLHLYSRQVLGRDIISWAMLRTTLHDRVIDWSPQR